jgi:hypothetical protein
VDSAVPGPQTLLYRCLHHSHLPRSLELFLFLRSQTTNSLFHQKSSKQPYIMADITGPPMSYSSMKGRLHDGLLKGLEVMGYE